MTPIEKPQLVDYYPMECAKIKHIKGSLYESYLIISEESLFTKNVFEEILEYTIREARSNNFFVKSIYCKYRIMSTGETVYALELVKLKDPIFHHSIHIVNGSIKARGLIESKQDQEHS